MCHRRSSPKQAPLSAGLGPHHTDRASSSSAPGLLSLQVSHLTRAGLAGDRGGREPLSICVLPSPCPLRRFAKGVSHRCQMRGGAAYSFQLSLDSNPPCPPPSRKMSSNSSLSCQKIQDLPPRTCTSNNILHPPKHHKKDLPHQLISGLSSSYILSCMSHYLISAD